MGKKQWMKPFLAMVVVFLLVLTDGFGLLDLFKGGLLAATQPVVRFVSAVVLDTKNLFGTVATVRQKIVERNELEKKVKTLEAGIALLKVEQEENVRLKSLLSLKQRLPYSTRTAAVVSADLSGGSGSVIVDKGLNDGVGNGDAVIDEHGNLLGVIRETYVSSSKFSLLTDGSVKIDAHVPGKPALGVVTGSHGVGLKFDFISQETTLDQGETVVTSGLSGRLPEGILIGSIDKQQSKGSDLFQKISIVPAANLKDFQYVLVITSF